MGAFRPRPFHLAIRITGSAAGGAALALTFPPTSLSGLAWLALVPSLLAFRSVGPWGSIGLGLVFGAAAAIPLAAWIPGAVLAGFRARPSGAVGLWLLTAFSFVPALILFGFLTARLSLNRVLYAPTVGVLWALAELSHARLWPEIPWAPLGATQIDQAIAPLAAVAGVHGISAFVAATNALVTQALCRVSLAKIATAAIATAGIAALGGVLGERTLAQPSSTFLRVAVVQPAVPMPARPDLAFQHETIEALLDLSHSIQGADLIAWPESVLRSAAESTDGDVGRIIALVEDLGASLILGGRRRDGDRWHNSAILVAPSAVPSPIYDKRKPLPIAEAAPRWVGPRFRRALGGLVALVPWAPGGSRGIKLENVGSPEILICYEAIFSGFPEDPAAGLLLNLVNDGWYDQTKAAAQHFLLSRWRAVETGAPLLRAASTGISAVIDRKGRTLAELGVHRRGVLVAELPITAVVTPFEHWGYWPLILVGVFCAIPYLARGSHFLNPGGSASKRPETTA
jgi:apolipoprotein N-acyltransferase